MRTFGTLVEAWKFLDTVDGDCSIVVDYATYFFAYKYRKSEKVVQYWQKVKTGVC